MLSSTATTTHTQEDMDFEAALDEKTLLELHERSDTLERCGDPAVLFPALHAYSRPPNVQMFLQGSRKRSLSIPMLGYS